MNCNIDNMDVIVYTSIFLAKILANFSNVYLKFYNIFYSPVAKIEAKEYWWQPGLVITEDLFARVTLFRPSS
jgi:hypothetical protein